METIYIKKHTDSTEDSQAARFVVPAVMLQTRNGGKRIPHPYGTETMAYPALETAIQQCHRAGYPVEYEGKHYPLPDREKMAPPPARLTTTSPLQNTLNQALPSLREQLTDNIPQVVASAALALGELKDEVAIPALVHVLSHDDATVRKNAADALAKLGKPAVDAIHLSLKDKHWVVRHSALCALEMLVTMDLSLAQPLIGDAVPLLADDHWLVRSLAAQVLTQTAKILGQTDTSGPG